MRSLILVTILLLIVTNCSSNKAISKLESSKFYRRDMIIEYNKELYDGIAVLPEKEKYSLSIKSKGKLDLFIMSTCHKEETKEKAWNIEKTVRGGLFGWGRRKIKMKNEVKFDYYPTVIEADGDCSMELGGYEIEKGRHSWAFIDFENKQYQSKATLSCNGRKINSNGTSVCQARKGLVQHIKFEENMLVSPSTKCMLPRLEGVEFEWPIVQGKCLYIFMGSKPPYKMHKLTTLGYESILIRGDK